MLRFLAWSSLLLFASIGFAGAAAPKFLPRTNIHAVLECPLDPHDLADPNKIQLQYKMFNPDAHELPHLFLIGGGPATPSLGNYDDLLPFTKYFRVVAFDQRGVGASSPLDPDWVEKNPLDTFRFFSTDAHVADLRALVETVARPGEHFYLAAHSYGGEILSRYLETLQDNDRAPQGLLWMGTLGAATSIQKLFDERIKMQIEVNHLLFGSDESLKSRFVALKNGLREYYSQAGREVNDYFRIMAEFLWDILDYLPEGETNFEGLLDNYEVALRAGSVEPLQSDSLAYDFHQPLVQVLDWRFGLPYSQARLIQNLDLEVHLRVEDWMITEADVLLSDANRALYPPIRARTLMELEQSLERAHTPHDLKALGARLASIPSIQLMADQDLFVPFSLARESFAAHHDMGARHHHFEVMERSGHGGFFNQIVADFVAEKWEELQCERFANQGT